MAPAGRAPPALKQLPEGVWGDQTYYELFGYPQLTPISQKEYI